LREPKRTFRYKLMKQFLIEAEKWLNEFDEVLRVYNENTEEQNKTLFRIAHNLKGSTLTLELQNTAEMALKAEDFLKGFINGDKKVLNKSQLKSLAEWSSSVRLVLDGFQNGEVDESAVNRDISGFFSNKRHQGI